MTDQNDEPNGAQLKKVHQNYKVGYLPILEMVFPLWTVFE